MNYDEKFHAIHNAAQDAANKAAREKDRQLGPEAERGLDCGFAWVQINPATNPFARWLKAQNIGSKHWDKGVYVWGSKLHDIPTQSLGVHEAAARAYADSIRESLKALSLAPDISVGTRYD